MGLILQCPHCSDCFMAEGNCVGNEAVCPFCGGNFQANAATTASESPQAEQDFAKKHETSGVVAKLFATCSSITVTAGAAAQLFWLNIRLLFARGVNRSKALVRLGEQCYEERRLVAEEIELYKRLDSHTRRSTDLELALAADAGAVSAWWDKLKQIGGRWAKRAELAKNSALKMKLHRDLGERFFQSQGGAQTEDPAVAQVVAEQQRIRELESRAEELQLRVPKILAHPAVAGAVMVALLAVAALAMPKELTTAILPIKSPISSSSSGGDSAEIAKGGSSKLSASPSGLRRGPKIHGFQIGMTLDEFRTNLKNVYPGEVDEEMFQDGTHLIDLQSNCGDSVFDELFGPDVERFGVYYTPKQGGFPLVIVAVAGDQETIISMKFDSSILVKLFNLRGLTFKGFCQELINSYNIPKLEPMPDRVVQSMTNLAYESTDEGYSIECTPTFSLNLGIRPIDSQDRGFGR